MAQKRSSDRRHFADRRLLLRIVERRSNRLAAQYGETMQRAGRRLFGGEREQLV